MDRLREEFEEWVTKHWGKPDFSMHDGEWDQCYVQQHLNLLFDGWCGYAHSRHFQTEKNKAHALGRKEALEEAAKALQPIEDRHAECGNRPADDAVSECIVVILSILAKEPK